MSIVRWCRQESGKISDVYIYYDVDGGITCLSALDDERSFNVPTLSELKQKLKDEFQDHYVPEFVFTVEEQEE